MYVPTAPTSASRGKCVPDASWVRRSSSRSASRETERGADAIVYRQVVYDSPNPNGTTASPLKNRYVLPGFSPSVQLGLGTTGCT
eukprot:1586915-Prymnesium_polylepis.2